MDPEDERSATVFLSYSREDQKRALPVIKALEHAGLNVWWDGLLEGGDTFLPTTERALETADAVVVLWSKASVQSHWVRDEATRGRERSCLVPLSLDGTHPPLGFRQFQTIDISKWRGRPDAPGIERAVRAIRGFAGQAQTKPMPLPRQPMVSRRAMLAGGAVLLAGGAGALAWKFGSGVLAATGNSVAVLPFRNLSGDPGQDYFVEGISEQIRSTLSRNEKLLVLAPTSISAAVKDGILDERAIAAKLGVAFVLGGSVRRSGDQLRINARLVDGQTGRESWHYDYDKPLRDVFALQDEIAGRVAGAMAAQTVSAGQAAAKGPGGTTSLTAYDAYLRGNAYYALRTGEAAYRSALAQYYAAIAEDPGFAAAHAARARTLVVITSSGTDASQFEAAYNDAWASARRAVELAPDYAQAHSTLGYVLVQGKLDLRAAAAPFAKARELGSGDSAVMSLYAAFAAETARKAEADAAITRAAALDPLNPRTHAMGAFVAYCARQWDQAIERNRRALALNPQIDQVHGFLGDALCQQGKFADALREYEQEPDPLGRQTGLAIASLRIGNAAAARQATDRLVAAFGDAATYQQAQILAQSGQLDQAMAKLLHARQIGDVGLALSFTDPLLDPLRGRPDFSQLLSRLGFG